jgi:uncharacterized damage-inducible protein DinB
MTGPFVPSSYSPQWRDASRTEPPDVGDELAILNSFLDWHRATLELKCEGIPQERLSERSVPPSSLSLHGLLRHLAAAERWWFRIQFAGEQIPMLFYSDDDPNQDFDDLDGDINEAFDVWRKECEHSRRIVAAAPTLDETGIRRSTGEPISLRRIMVHMIAEYARHNGHADLLRERIDGAIGI